ncbi:MAG: cell envelope integrity protein TolA [Alphaproteobacteria bacterium]|nr:cell envelope integrity protein TolA [Alphaproteobacteria bacterium]
MLQRARALWQENRAGLTGSVLLHLAFILIAFWWSITHPVARQPPLKPMLVDLVVLPPAIPGPQGGAERSRPAATPSAPKVEGVRPRATAPPPDELESRIAKMAELRAPDTALPAPDNASGSGTGAGTDQRWWPQLEHSAARGTPVAIRLKLSRAGVISDVQIVDQARYANDKLFRGMAVSARNAALLASPISLPPGHYDAVMDIALTLDPKAALH